MAAQLNGCKLEGDLGANSISSPRIETAEMESDEIPADCSDGEQQHEESQLETDDLENHENESNDGDSRIIETDSISRDDEEANELPFVRHDKSPDAAYQGSVIMATTIDYKTNSGPNHSETPTASPAASPPKPPAYQLTEARPAVGSFPQLLYSSDHSEPAQQGHIIRFCQVSLDVDEATFGGSVGEFVPLTSAQVDDSNEVANDECGQMASGERISRGGRRESSLICEAFERAYSGGDDYNQLASEIANDERRIEQAGEAAETTGARFMSDCSAPVDPRGAYLRNQAPAMRWTNNGLQHALQQPTGEGERGEQVTYLSEQQFSMHQTASTRQTFSSAASDYEDKSISGPVSSSPGTINRPLSDAGAAPGSHLNGNSHYHSFVPTSNTYQSQNVVNVDVNNNNIAYNLHQLPSDYLQQQQQQTEDCCIDPYLAEQRHSQPAMNGACSATSTMKYDNGGHIIEYKPMAGDEQQQEGQQSYGSVLADAPAAYSQHDQSNFNYYPHHQPDYQADQSKVYGYHQQYVGCDGCDQYPDISSDDSSGKTYHLLGQTNLSSLQHQQQQQQQAPLYGYDRWQVNETDGSGGHPLEATGELHPLDSYGHYGQPELGNQAPGMVGFESGEQSSNVDPAAAVRVPIVSHSYDPNSELSGCLMDPIQGYENVAASSSSAADSIATHQADERVSAAGKAGAGRGSGARANNDPSGSLKAPRCSPETIERLRAYLRRRVHSQPVAADGKGGAGGSVIKTKASLKSFPGQSSSNGCAAAVIHHRPQAPPPGAGATCSSGASSSLYGSKQMRDGRASNSSATHLMLSNKSLSSSCSLTMANQRAPQLAKSGSLCSTACSSPSFAGSSPDRNCTLSNQVAGGQVSCRRESSASAENRRLLRSRTVVIAPPEREQEEEEEEENEVSELNGRHANGSDDLVHSCGVQTRASKRRRRDEPLRMSSEFLNRESPSMDISSDGTACEGRIQTVLHHRQSVQ